MPLNRIRRQKIEEVRDRARKRGKKPDIKSVLLAYIEPTLQFKESNPQAEDFLTFIGRSITDPDDTVRKVFQRFIMPLFQLLLETTCDALHTLPRDIVFWRLQFAMGSLFHTLHICGKFNSSAMPQQNKDLNSRELMELIIPFVSAGMRAK